MWEMKNCLNYGFMYVYQVSGRIVHHIFSLLNKSLALYTFDTLCKVNCNNRMQMKVIMWEMDYYCLNYGFIYVYKVSVGLRIFIYIFKVNCDIKMLMKVIMLVLEN